MSSDVLINLSLFLTSGEDGVPIQRSEILDKCGQVMWQKTVDDIANDFIKIHDAIRNGNEGATVWSLSASRTSGVISLHVALIIK